MDEPIPGEPDADQRISSEFRNGSVTAVGVILGFSLTFLNQWVSNPVAWSRFDIVAAVPIIIGILFQGKALADLLRIDSLVLRNYDRARLVFLIGLALVAVGVAAAILLDIFGLGPRTLAR